MGKFRRSDFPEITDYILDELSRRQTNRKDMEKNWKEVDRQISMKPDISYKLTNGGKRDPDKAWMPETELPLQAQSLEVLVADARRMKFPDAGNWFSAHSALTDDYLQRADLQSIITGDKNEVPTQIDQDAADKLTQGILNHFHRQYNFYDNIARIDAEAFKYGMGLGRGRVVNASVIMNTTKGVKRKDQRIPVLLPWSIKDTYLDDRTDMIMNQGHLIGPAQIFCSTQNIRDLRAAAKSGESDPLAEQGGWMPSQLNDIEGDSKGKVEVVEWEGDLVIPRKTSGDIFIPGAIVTLIKSDRRIFRFRWRKYGFSSYIEFPYHRENIDDPYATSPLLKGWPLQKAAVDAMNRLLIIAALNGAPPVSWDSDDPHLKAMGGPVIKPFATWPTAGNIKVNQIGDPGALLSVYQNFINQYYDVVGVNPPRLGERTVSHTTAYSKQAEISQGTSRTVNYVRRCLKGPMEKWLNMAFEMGKDVLTPTTLYIDDYKGYVDVNKKHIPDLATFDAYGAGGPQEQQIADQKKLASLQMAISMDQLGVQLGRQPEINLEAAIEEVLRNGGWTDTDIFTTRNTTINGDAGQPQLQGYPGQTEASPASALQAINLARG